MQNFIKKDHLMELPVLPLREVAVYPNIITPLFVGREKSIKALEQAMEKHNKQILLISQKDSTIENPEKKDLYKIGTCGSILQLLKLPDGNVKVLVEGETRIAINEFIPNKNYLSAEFTELETIEDEEQETLALINLAISTFEQYSQFNKNIPDELITTLSEIKEAGYLADAISVHLPLTIEERQKLIEILNGSERLESLMIILNNTIELAKVEQQITSRIQKQVKQNQKEYYLKEQMEAIQKELNKESEDGDDIQILSKKIDSSGMPIEAKKKSKTELDKLKRMHPMSPEATVLRNYLDCLLNIPWKKRTKIKHDLIKAEKTLDEEHYGLEKVKERIIEYLAVQSRVKKPKGSILCLVGPPGVGKTSLGKSIAHATGREFVRMSLGGVHDEAEIRGHRRTYVGSLPGKIIQNLIKAGVKNPLFLLDEMDKISVDFHGDPASALLEALDSEQNNTFSDHYLEVDYDLSDVMFITTSNTLNIPLPLLDRMEIIHLSGYTEDEKINIATKHLIPKQFKLNGLNTNELKISEEIIQDIIRYYTRESGVRNLERELSKICRKVVKEIAFGKKLENSNITLNMLEHYLGVQKHRFCEAFKEDQIGQVTGLAWTEVGGEMLTIEAVTMPGKGNAIITGQLGDVMKESVQAAMSVVKSRANLLGIPHKFFEKNDIHVHVPEGAIPKDGPSAGITMCTALVSILTKIPVRSNFAMTGEITLRGEILPIGGLKEKLLAARRGNIKHVIIPEENKRDLKEIPENVTKDLEIHPLRWIDEVLKLVLLTQPKPLNKIDIPIENVISNKKKILTDKTHHKKTN